MKPGQSRLMLVLMILPLLTLSCTRSMGDRINRGPFAWYMGEMIKASGAQVEIQTCEMFSGTRAGSCRLKGQPEALKAFVKAFAAGEENLDVVFKNSCLNFADYGIPPVAGKHGHRPKKGCMRHKADKTKLPPNQKNVHVRALYLAPGAKAVCVELFYPYG